jgi:hypothetical protein
MSQPINEKLQYISLKLVKVIETRNVERVRYLSKALERQQDPMNTVKIFLLITRYLQQTDRDLYQWFQDIYFEDVSPEVRQMWLDFIELCGLGFPERIQSVAA